MLSLNRIKKVINCRFLLLSVLFIGNSCYKAASQSNIGDMKKSAGEATLPVVVLPSPNAATLTRNISENVDLYTGKLSIDIPIYTLKSRNVEVPISLQANASAHRVDDVGSWAGLGWFLNAGGVITRVMKNLPDEYNATISSSFSFPGVGYLNLNTAANGYTVLERFGPVVIPYSPYTINEMKSIINRGNWNTRTNTPDKGFDLQPDEFYFNFGRYSGKFVFDNFGGVRLITDANLFITPTISSGKITAFTVLTDDGYKYEFGNYALNAVEESKLTTSTKNMQFTFRYTGCMTSMDFTHPGGDGIGQFSINQPAYIYESSPYVMGYNGFVAGATTYTEQNLMNFNHGNNQQTTEYPTYPSAWYLTKITSPTGDFVTLNYINNGTLSYVTDRVFASADPERISSFACAIDLNIFTGPWFKSLVPPKNLFGSFQHYPSFGDVSVTTNTITLASKKLKEIVTSQGYKVDFISTTGRLDLPGDKRLDKISISNNGALVKEFLLDYEVVQNTEPVETLSWNYKAPKHVYTQSGIFQYHTYEPQTIQLPGNIDAGMRYRMYLKKITEKGANQETVPAYSFDYFNKADLPFRTSRSQNLFGFTTDNTGQPVLNKLLAGVLKTAKYPTGGYKEFEYEISGTAASLNGLRIKSIKEYESATASPVIKNYTYGTFTATDVAIGSYNMPDVVVSFTNNGNTALLPVTRKYFSSSARVNPQMTTRGAVGGYSFVEVSQPNNGSYRVEFTVNDAQHSNVHTPSILVSSLNGGFTKDLNTINVWYPFPEHTQNDWMRGLPVAEYVKAQDGKTIQSTLYDYDLTSAAASQGSSFGMQVTKYRIDFGADWNWLVYGRYAFYPQWQLLKSKTIRQYAPDGLNYRETVVENTYDRPTYNSKQLLLVRQVKTTNSKNEQIFQKYKYALDYAGGTDAFAQGIAQLKTKNVLTATIEKYQYIQKPDGSSKRYVGGLINKYYSDKPLLMQSFSWQPPSSLASYTESAISGNSFTYDANYKSIQNFTAYTPFGGVQEQNQEADVKEAYIWDHNNSLPTAKVINAAANDVCYTSFEADSRGNWIYNPANTGQGDAVTGKKYYSLPVYYTNEGFLNSGPLNSAQKYKLTLWVKLGDPYLGKYTSSNSTVYSFANYSPLITVNGWRYYEIDLENVVKVEIGRFSNVGTIYLDEVRLFPKNAQMTTYTFNPLVGMTSQCDPNNRIVYYEYDGLQRLKLLKDQYGNVTKTFEYNYKQ